MHLYLIRHGESYINIPTEGVRQRNELDLGLTNKGQKQALTVAKWMKPQVPHINVLYTSIMKRAQETAQYLVDIYQCALVFDDRLREIGTNRGVTYLQYMGKRDWETWRLHYLSWVDHLAEL